jgi:hypothetical protein
VKIQNAANLESPEVNVPFNQRFKSRQPPAREVRKGVHVLKKIGAVIVPVLGCVGLLTGDFEGSFWDELRTLRVKKSTAPLRNVRLKSRQESFSKKHTARICLGHSTMTTHRTGGLRRSEIRRSKLRPRSKSSANTSSFFLGWDELGKKYCRTLVNDKPRQEVCVEDRNQIVLGPVLGQSPPEKVEAWGFFLGVGEAI